MFDWKRREVLKFDILKLLANQQDKFFLKLIQNVLVNKNIFVNYIRKPQTLIKV